MHAYQSLHAMSSAQRGSCAVPIKLEVHVAVLFLQVRFSTFVWVQALDLAILTARSGALCALPQGFFQSTQRCILAVLSSHILITYIFAGCVVWYMDMQARCSFIQYCQHALRVVT